MVQGNCGVPQAVVGAAPRSLGLAVCRRGEARRIRGSPLVCLLIDPAPLPPPTPRDPAPPSPRLIHGHRQQRQDLSTKYASVLFGTTNAAASLAGSVYVTLVGVILDATHSWALVFGLVAAGCFASALFYLLCGTSEPQFE